MTILDIINKQADKATTTAMSEMACGLDAIRDCQGAEGINFDFEIVGNAIVATVDGSDHHKAAIFWHLSNLLRHPDWPKGFVAHFTLDGFAITHTEEG